MKLFNAKSMPPPQLPVGERLTRRPHEDDSVAAVTRDQKPNGRRAFNMKFRFNGCWHRGEKGPSRKANPAKNIAGCPKFDRLKAQNNGAPPVGYKGAYEKARDLAWDKFSKKKGDKINQLDDGDTDDEDFSDVESETDHNGMFALTAQPAPKSFAHKNVFDELDDGESDMDEDVINHFSSWAHKVNGLRIPGILPVKPQAPLLCPLHR